MWLVKKNRIVPMSIDCIGLGTNGLLVVSSSSKGHRSNRTWGNDLCIVIHDSSSIILDATEDITLSLYDEYVKVNGIRSVCGSSGEIYLIVTAWACILPSIIIDSKIIPLGYDRIDDGIYIYDWFDRNNRAFTPASRQHHDYKYHGWYGTISTIIGDHLMFCSHSTMTLIEYDLVNRKQTFLPTKRLVVRDDGSEYESPEYINVGIEVVAEKDGIVVKDYIPSNIYHFTNRYGECLTRITGITSIGNYIIATFNNTSSANICKSIAVRYSIEDGSLIDYSPIVRKANRKVVVHSNMDHMMSNGRLMVGIDTIRNTICIMNEEMDIISTFKPKNGAPLYSLNKIANIIIDYEDNIHLVTDDMKNVITTDINGKLLNILSPSRISM